MIHIRDKIGIALLLGIIAAFLIVICSPGAQDSALFRGDFPGFYVLAKIITDYNHTELYNLDLQRKIQNDYWPEMNGNFLISVYPPSLAIILSPLGFFSAREAQLIYTLSSLLSLIAATILLKKSATLSQNYPWLCISLIFTNPFILIGTVGGQNTAFSIAIISLGIYLITQGRHLSSGFIFSLWLLKPQFGILIIPLLCTFRLWRSAIGFTIGAAIHYILGIIILGPLWITIWLEKIKLFSGLNYHSNDGNQASIIGTVKVFNHQFLENINLLVPAWLIIGLLAIIVFLNINRIIYTSGQEASLKYLWACCGTIPLIAPQTLFYDLGITFFCMMTYYCSIKNQFFQNSILKLIIAIQIFCWLLSVERSSRMLPLFAAAGIACSIMAIYMAGMKKDRIKNPLVPASKPR